MSTVKACLDQNDVSPKEQSRCNKFISFLAVFALVNFFFQYTLFSTDLSIRTFIKPAALLQFVVSLSLIVVSLYIYYKNKVLHYLLRLLPCVFVSMILMNIFSNMLGAAALVLWCVASIYVNRKYFKILALRKNYLHFIIWCTALMIVGSVIAAALTHEVVTPSTVNMILFIGLVEGLGSTALLWQLLSKEIAAGQTFYEAIRYTVLIPTTFMFLLGGLLTAVPIKFFSGEYLFGEDGNDYLQMPESK